MTDERRLIEMGIPAADAISMCYSMRRDGTLTEFIKHQEKERGERVSGIKFEPAPQARR